MRIFRYVIACAAIFMALQSTRLRANDDYTPILAEVEDLKRKFGSTIDVAVFALGFNEDERGQLARLFTGEQIVLECEECEDFVSMKLPSSPHRLVIDRAPLKILMEERPGITSEERGALLVKLERILRQRGYRTPAA